jgi:hypothetical protein
VSDATTEATDDVSHDLRWWAPRTTSRWPRYLEQNPLLREPARALGNQSGLSLIHVALNRLIRATGHDCLYVTGPGHGGPALIAGGLLRRRTGTGDVLRSAAMTMVATSTTIDSRRSLVFSGGVGERDDAIRARACDPLRLSGVEGPRRARRRGRGSWTPTPVPCSAIRDRCRARIAGARSALTGRPRRLVDPARN